MKPRPYTVQARAARRGLVLKLNYPYWYVDPRELLIQRARLIFPIARPVR